MLSHPKLMVVASAGGHWVQLMRMRKAWNGLDVIYMTTESGLSDIVESMAKEEGNPPPKFTSVTDANLSRKLHLLRQLSEVLVAVLRHREAPRLRVIQQREVAERQAELLGSDV